MIPVEQIEEVSQTLARALGLVHPGHRSLRELADEVVKELERARRDLEELT